MKSTAHITRFKIVGDIEGLSYLILLFIAMPLKYWAHNPFPVKYTGMAHGVLFCLFIVAILECGLKENWSIKKYALAFVSSLIPFGTFIFNKKFL